MYLLSRQVKIIRYLKGKGTFVKGNELAKILGVTDRTIRNDIAAIKDVTSDSSSIFDSLAAPYDVMDKIWSHL